MRVNIKFTNINGTETIKDFINEKLSGLDRYFDNIQQIDVEVGKTSQHHNKGDVFFCEVNISVPKTLLRYREETDDLYKAITSTKKGAQQKLKEYKEKMREA